MRKHNCFLLNVYVTFERGNDAYEIKQTMTQFNTVRASAYTTLLGLV